MTTKSSGPNSVSMIILQSRYTIPTCCFCIPLRIGCFILGYLNLIFNLLKTLLLLLAIVAIGEAIHGIDHLDSSDISELDTNDDRSYFLNIVGMLYIFAVVINLAWLGVNIACLVGLHKNRPGPIRVYVAFATARLILTIVGTIDVAMTTDLNRYTFFHGVDICLAIYFTAVYYVYAVRLERENAVRAVQAQTMNKNVSQSYDLSPPAFIIDQIDQEIIR